MGDRDWVPGALIAACIAAVIALVVWLAFAISASENNFKAHCKSMGGHIVSDTSTSTVTTVNGKGQVGVGTSTTTTDYCLNPQGGILDIWSD